MARLRVDRSTGDPAPHKPLLLLVILGLAERGRLGEVLDLTAELAFEFYSYFSVVHRRGRAAPDVRLPFHHMRGDDLWTPLLEDGEISDNRKRTAKARISPDLLTFAMDPQRRELGRRMLIANYFKPGEQPALYALTGLEMRTNQEIAEDAQVGDVYVEESVGREARFRIDVVTTYNYTCALTRHRLLTIDGGSIVDAAHIRPFANSRNNETRNGFALSKNMHWAFDAGLWSADDDFRILVAKDAFAEQAPDVKPFADYDGVMLHLPADRLYWPDINHFQWHRRHRFRG